MRSDIKFSIITPVYKAERYLPKCIESVLNQTYENWELILVDDGSPDKCPEICDEYAQKCTKINVIHNTWGGVSRARNTGLDAVSGDYILWLDSDDTIEPQTLRRCYEEIIVCNPDMVVFNRRDIYSDGDVMTSITETTKFNDLLDRAFPLFQGFYIDSGYFVFSNSLWKDVRFRSDIKYEDAYASVDIYLKNPQIRYISDCLYNYERRNSQSILHTVNEDPKDAYYHFCVEEHSIKYLELHNSKWLEFAKISTLKYALRMYNIDNAIHCLKDVERDEIKRYIDANVSFVKKLNMEYKLYYAGYRGLKIITWLKGLEYRHRYKRSK